MRANYHSDEQLVDHKNTLLKKQLINFLLFDFRSKRIYCRLKPLSEKLLLLVPIALPHMICLYLLIVTTVPMNARTKSAFCISQ